MWHMSAETARGVTKIAIMGQDLDQVLVEVRKRAENGFWFADFGFKDKTIWAELSKLGYTVWETIEGFKVIWHKDAEQILNGDESKRRNL